MNEIDLTKILKDCPKGTKLYSTIFGEVEFVRISGENSHPVILKAKDESVINVDSEGKHFSMYEGECTLFPSKDQRDWSKFTAPWYKKEKLVELKESDDEKIRRWIIDDIRYNMNNEPLNNSEYKKKAEKAIAWLENKCESLRTNDRAWLYLVSDVLTWKDGIGQYLDNPRVQELAKRLCSEYAQKLYNPSVISSSSNTVKNEQKFDPKTLQPFDRILIRDRSNGKWSCSLFSHIDNELQYPSVCANGLTWKCCIPYNEETEHLVGTNEEAPEFYRYWED